MNTDDSETRELWRNFASSRVSDAGMTFACRRSLPLSPLKVFFNDMWRPHPFFCFKLLLHKALTLIFFGSYVCAQIQIQEEQGFVILETACCLLFQTHLVTAALSQAWHSLWTPQQCESHYTSRKLLWIVDASTHKKEAISAWDHGTSQWGPGDKSQLMMRFKNKD